MLLSFRKCTSCSVSTPILSLAVLQHKNWSLLLRLGASILRLYPGYLQPGVGCGTGTELLPLECGVEAVTVGQGLFIFIAPSHPPRGGDQAVMPTPRGRLLPHPIRVRGPDLWYQMALVDTTVEQILI